MFWALASPVEALATRFHRRFPRISKLWSGFECLPPRSPSPAFISAQSLPWSWLQGRSRPRAILSWLPRQYDSMRNANRLPIEGPGFPESAEALLLGGVPVVAAQTAPATRTDLVAVGMRSQVRPNIALPTAPSLQLSKGEEEMLPGCACYACCAFPTGAASIWSRT